MALLGDLQHAFLAQFTVDAVLVDTCDLRNPLTTNDGMGGDDDTLDHVLDPSGLNPLKWGTEASGVQCALQTILRSDENLVASELQSTTRYRLFVPLGTNLSAAHVIVVHQRGGITRVVRVVGPQELQTQAFQSVFEVEETS